MPCIGASVLRFLRVITEIRHAAVGNPIRRCIVLIASVAPPRLRLWVWFAILGRRMRRRIRRVILRTECKHAHDMEQVCSYLMQRRHSRSFVHSGSLRNRNRGMVTRVGVGSGRISVHNWVPHRRRRGVYAALVCRIRRVTIGRLRGMLRHLRIRRDRRRGMLTASV